MTPERVCASPLGATKAEDSFGPTLLKAIKTEFGTRARFAEAYGCTGGRVTQMIKGPERLEPETLDRILATFESPSLQSEIHAAWVQGNAPLPTPEELARSSDDPETLLRELAERTPMRAFKVAEALRRETRDPNVWQEATTCIAQMHLRFDQGPLALLELQEMERIARLRHEPRDIFTVLWMRGQTLRLLGSGRLREFVELHNAAIETGLAWKTTAQADREFKRRRRSELERDYALILLHMSSRVSPSGREELLAEALKHVSRSMELHADNGMIYRATEIRSRIEIALGQHFKAEESLDELESMVLRDPHTAARRTISTAEIAVARGEQDRAIELLRPLLEETLEAMDLRHHRSAREALIRILGRS